MNKKKTQSKEPFIKQLQAVQNLKQLKGHYPDRIIASFLEKDENKKLLAYTLAQPSTSHITKLDQAFKEHYAEIKFIKYISTILHYESIHYNQKQSQRLQRQICFDPNEDTHEQNLLAELGQEDQHVDQTSLVDQITDHSLYKAFQDLTPRQQKILQLFFGQQITDREIAAHFNVSQQAISASRLAALKKLRSVLEERQKSGSVSKGLTKEAQTDG